MSRFGGGLPRFTGHPWSDRLGTALDDLLRRLFQFQSIAQKNPGPATQIQAGVAATPGTTLTAEPLAKDDHVHSTETGAPIGLSNDNAEGTGTSLLRAGAHIKRDVRVELSGVDVGTRNALSFSAAFTVTDNPGSDRVDVDIAGLSAVDLEFLSWVL